MTPSQRERLRIVIRTGLLVRQGMIITPEVADERSKNLTVIIEDLVREFEEEDAPVIQSSETSEAMAARLIR